jgi:hypothetical protein
VNGHIASSTTRRAAVEAGLTICIGELRVVAEDGKGIQSQGQPDPGGHTRIYGDLALQFGGVSNLRQ